MANAEIGALRVTLSMNAGEFTRGAKSAARDVDSLGSTFKRLSDTVEAASYEFNSGMMAAQRMMSSMNNVIRVASDFGSGMSAVSTLVDTSKESMSEMTAKVLELGRRMPVALTDLTTGLYDLRSAGTSADDQFARLEGSAKLATAALGTTQQAVDIVTSAVNAWGLEGAKAEQIYDQVFKATAYGKMTVEQLSQGFGAVAGTVAQAGIKIDEYLSAVAALTTTGLPAAVAHTQIRAAIAGMTRESELATKVLDAMGVKTFAQLIEKSGGMVNAFKNITIALGNNDANMIKLFGSVEAYNAVIGLTGKQADVFNQALSDMREGEEKLGEAFDKRTKGMGSAMQTMKNATDELMVSLGEALLPAVVAVRDAVVSITTAFKSLDPAIQSSISKVVLIGTVIGPTVIALGFFLNGLSALLPVIGAVGSALALLTSGPIGMTAIAITGLVTAAVYFRDQVMDAFNAVERYIGDKVNMIRHNLRELKESFTNMWNGEESKGGLTVIEKTTTDVFRNIKMSMDGVVATYDAMDLKKQEAAQKAWSYAGPVIDATKAETQSLHDRNSAMREGLQIFNETLTPMEEIIFKQMKLHALFTQGALDAVSYGRAMAQASAFSAKNMDALASTVSSNLQTIFGDTKAVAIATALINTYQGITRALATYPPPISTAMAAIQAAAGFAQVANIRKQTSKGGGGGGSSGGGGGGTVSSSAGTVPQMLTVQGLTRGQFLGGEYVRDLAQSLLQYQRDGGQVVLQS